MVRPLDTGRRPKVVVCGTRWGRVYLQAFLEPDFPFELVGIVGQGSDRSTACARYYDVPLYTDVQQVPDDVDIACVVISAGVQGGRGAEIAQAFMDRGMHVLQEHALHHDELAACLRAARRNGVQYRLNTHYPHIEPVRRFIAAARELFTKQRPQFIDATCAIQVAYTLFDILGRALGGARPWGFADIPAIPDELRSLTELEFPYRSANGVFAGVPMTLRMQNQMKSSDPDNYTHLFHRITVGTDGGHLTLVNTQGPVLWSPRPHGPEEAWHTVRLFDTDAVHLTYPSASVLGPVTGPDYREIVGSVWPGGVRTALGALRRAAVAGDDPLKEGQYYLTLCRLWQDLTTRLGYPTQLTRSDAPDVLPADDLEKAALAVGPKDGWRD
ncbi:Gfo/Idh/MocA family oxidoreductase [Streptomyces sp. NPDC050315]|uniref:Gfo/Idh/MocA family oxidoreductase n=1 Tax=Streptomyces sp. NPDC050315 TaxID=3155039 RepID=UPI003447ABA4